MRLNQAIAKTGYCSRRKADLLISSKQVTVNNQLVTNYSKSINPDVDTVAVKGKVLRFQLNQYVVLNKPPGVVTSTVKQYDHKTILELLPSKLQHLRPVGRLDMYSEGLIILTNDGSFAQKLTHPSKHINKIYLVRIRGRMTDNDLKRIRQGVPLEDGMTLPATVELCKQSEDWSEFKISLRQGRNRQIRNICAYLGYPVIYLKRVSIGRLQLGKMETGTWRILSDAEIKLLLT